jgi:heptosyltransferase-2
MSAPAVTVLRRRLPGAHVAMLARASVAPLWALCGAVDEVLVAPERGALAWACGPLHRQRFDRAYVFPNSFRSALLPWLARVPIRQGLRGHAPRSGLLTDTVTLLPGPGREHQMNEYFEIVGLEAERDRWELPLLHARAADLLAAQQRLEGLDGACTAGPGWIAMFPGAARGPAKRWPAARFACVARAALAEWGCRTLLLGSGADAPACGDVERQASGAAVNLAGRTPLAATAALLSLCRAAVANDSGGMHLAAGLGVGVVGIFGVTDPARTGPLGPGHRIVAADGWVRSRHVRRESDEAQRALAAVTEERVVRALGDVLAAGSGGGRG